ncbi:MAG: 16S rRNA (guanine(527)-N(7))-methyltransferase RsmG [Treponema sp.]|nr:16S rRNA (guanine(527)-N(7))-methyltransferase RsmG [Treponema sp.]
MDLLCEGLEQICGTDPCAALLIKPRITEISGLLDHYIDEIERFNSIYGLVKITDGPAGSSRETLIVKHILDSLSPLGHIARLLGFTEKPENILAGRMLADAGSGAGLPGIPLAICLPGVRITLIERMRKRAGFLRNTCAMLASAFPGPQFLCTNVEEIQWEKIQPNRFDCLVLRALSRLDNNFVAKLARLLKPGGTIAAYKGRHQIAQAEMDSLQEQTNFTALTMELIPLTVPFLDEERCMVLIHL